jgi:hypothetical protein
LRAGRGEIPFLSFPDVNLFCLLNLFRISESQLQNWSRKRSLPGTPTPKMGCFFVFFAFFCGNSDVLQLALGFRISGSASLCDSAPFAGFTQLSL